MDAAVEDRVPPVDRQLLPTVATSRTTTPATRTHDEPDVSGRQSDAGMATMSSLATTPASEARSRPVCLRNGHGAKPLIPALVGAYLLLRSLTITARDSAHLVTAAERPPVRSTTPVSSTAWC